MSEESDRDELEQRIEDTLREIAGISTDPLSDEKVGVTAKLVAQAVREGWPTEGTA